jgi:hypothetical protein
MVQGSMFDVQSFLNLVVQAIQDTAFESKNVELGTWNFELFIQHCCKYPTFAFLTTRSSIFYKRMAALMLLLVFVAIQLVKTFHTHETVVLKPLTEKTAFSNLTHPCPICDYDFAKDKDHVYQSFQIAASGKYFPEFVQHATRILTSVGATASGRGPPTS